MSKRKKNSIAKTMIGGCISLIGCLSIIAVLSTYNMYQTDENLLADKNINEATEEHVLALTINEPLEEEWEWEIINDEISEIENEKEIPAY